MDTIIISENVLKKHQKVVSVKSLSHQTENHFSQFYRTNFDPREERDVSRKFQSFVGNLSLPYLIEHESLELEAEINIEELQNALNSFQNNKTPGNDGFRKELYEAFFDLIAAAL